MFINIKMNVSQPKFINNEKSTFNEIEFDDHYAISGSPNYSIGWQYLSSLNENKRCNNIIIKKDLSNETNETLSIRK
jgi:hypothetical protein